MINISPTQLRKAADIQEKIQELQTKLSEILGAEIAPAAPTTEAAKPGKRGRKKISAQARAKMAAAQKARRAKERGEVVEAKVVEKPSSKDNSKKKRKVSPLLLAALAKAREARAAKRKAAKKA